MENKEQKPKKQPLETLRAYEIRKEMNKMPPEEQEKFINNLRNKQLKVMNAYNLKRNASEAVKAVSAATVLVGSTFLVGGIITQLSGQSQELVNNLLISGAVGAVGGKLSHEILPRVVKRLLDTKNAQEKNHIANKNIKTIENACNPFYVDERLMHENSSQNNFERGL